MGWQMRCYTRPNFTYASVWVGSQPWRGYEHFYGFGTAWLLVIDSARLRPVLRC